jgi:hypothetical protein
MEGMIGGAFADVLKENRGVLNAKFAEAKRLRPNLDPQAFSDLLCRVVEPIVAEAVQYDSSAAPRTALALYDLSLDLLGQGLLGSSSRHPVIEQGWEGLLTKIPRQVCEAPRKVAGALTNALYNLSQLPGARPTEWLETMLELAEHSKDVTTFLQAGQVAAWRAGLSHFRAGALELCLQIPPTLARITLGLPASDEPMDGIVKCLAADPWLHPLNIKGEGRKDTRQLKIVKRAGAFRGFGGLFRQPPMVVSYGEHFIVTDGDTRWLLVADVFGATFHRVDETVQPSKEESSFAIAQNNKVAFGRLNQKFDELENFTSAAANKTTLTVTTPLSFAVTFIALTET